MYQKPKVFIASSGAAKNLAQALTGLLAENDIEGRPWFVDTFHVGENTLNALLKATQQSDFAAVILTQDDTVVQNKDDRGLLLDAPRDNCIFELGLFMGALRDDQDKGSRCFMVSSVQEKALPSDLKGYTYVPFQPPKDLKNYGQCEDAMRDVVTKLVKPIKTKGKFYRPVVPFMSVEELIQKESAEGYLSRDSEVIVHAEKPHETKYHYAKIILNNMKRGIKYHYFFGTEAKGAIEIINLIQAMSVVDLKIGEKWDRIDDNERKKILKDPEDQKKIRENLDIMKTRLRIHVLPYKVSEAFCIHNAGLDQIPEKCYLRWDEANFLEVADRSKAKIKYDASMVFHHRQNSFFGKTKFLDIDEINRRLHLRPLIKQKFPPPLSTHVEGICFGIKKHVQNEKHPRGNNHQRSSHRNTSLSRGGHALRLKSS